MSAKRKSSAAPKPKLLVSTGDFYPEIQPYETFRLDVGNGHELYVEQSGNPKGLPVLFLHGGPGGGTTPTHRRFFNPKLYRIILFDQRGCGKSTPLAETKHNTTWDLVEDIERIRRRLRISTWHVFGGSWGSTLALTYAISHPERVRSLVLRGIFLCRRQEIDWFYERTPGASFIWPDAHDRFVSLVPESERDDIVKAYHKMLMSGDESVRNKAAIYWNQWEAAAAWFEPNPDDIRDAGNLHEALGISLENWYFMNGAFFPGNGRYDPPQKHWILKNIDRIRHIPAVVVQGRYDTDCPIRSAHDLVTEWPETQLIVVPNGNHVAIEPQMRRWLVTATDHFAVLDLAKLLR